MTRRALTTTDGRFKGPEGVKNMLAPNRRRSNLIAIAAICVATSCCGFVAGAWILDQPENVALAGKYHKTKYSQYEEEWVIRDYFRDQRSGFFVDVGANDYRHFSNTYYLETTLGWSGIAIDPQQQFASDYRLHRPRTRFFSLFVSDVSNATQRFYELEGNSLVASERVDFTKRYGGDPKANEVPTITLTDLLDRERVGRIDLLSMDIELAEPKALRGFAIDRFRPRLVCVEAHPEVRQQILDYFTRHSYVVVGRYVRADTHNLYFAPLARP
ncbi:MAG: FkbM family methyltransferase [Bacteroidales bacterium]